jgi:hypothetical protein
VYAAVDHFWNRMQEAQAALGYEVATRQWLDDRWMQQHGLSAALDRLFLADHEAEAVATARQGGRQRSDPFIGQ